jgi:hypothetical protein
MFRALINWIVVKAGWQRHLPVFAWQLNAFRTTMEKRGRPLPHQALLHGLGRGEQGTSASMRSAKVPTSQSADDDIRDYDEFIRFVS